MASGVTLTGFVGDPNLTVIDGGGEGRVLLCQDCSNETSIRDLTIAHGRAYHPQTGGGLCCIDSDPTIENVIFYENTGLVGGALSCNASSPFITDCVFSRNTDLSGHGGGVTLDGGLPNLLWCTFSGNSSAGGATVTVLAGYVNVLLSIVAFDQDGYGVDIRGGYAGFDRCDVHGNAAGEWAPGDSQDGTNSNFSADPQFCSSQPDDDRFWDLQADSPCIDPPQSGGRPIGARPVSCGVVAAESATWGRVKDLYR
jgi:hypothetical protein